MRVAFLAPIPLSDLKQLGEDLEKKEASYNFFLSPLVSYFVNRGIEVIVISLVREISGMFYQQNENITVYGIPLFKHGRVRAALNFRLEIQAIKKVLKKSCCDVVHVHWSYESALAALEYDTRKTIVTLHDWPYEIEKYLNNFYWKKRLTISKKVIEKGKNFTTVSEYIAGKLDYLEHKTAIVIPNFLDQQFCDDSFINRNKSYKIICINNGFDDRKNTKIAMKAFHRVLKKFPEAQMAMYGGGYEKNGAAFQWAKENALLEGITFRGQVSKSEIKEALEESLLLLHTSVEESFGLIYIEAMMCGTVVVAGKNSGATPAVLDNGRVGCLVDIHDDMKVAEKIIELLENPANLNSYINKGLQWVKENYMIESAAERYLEEYRKIMDDSDGE